MVKKRRAAASSVGSKRGRFRKVKAVFWFNVVVCAGLGVWFAFQPPARRAEVTRLVANAFEREKRVSALDVAWDIYQLYYGADFVAAAGAAAGDRTFVYGGVPRVAEGYAHTVRVLGNEGYLTGYAEGLASPVWAAYRMWDITPLPKAAERPESFEVDERTVARVSSDAFTGSGYDRGHLAPNHAIATRFGAEAQRETFLLSNIIPQRHGLNAGLWKQLEQRAATSFPARFGEVWVVAGPVFGAKPARLRGGPAVPEACYMIVVDENEGRVRAMAFLFPQEPAAGAELGDHVTSIDEVERRTGLDFFSELEDAAEAALEGRRVERVW